MIWYWVVGLIVVLGIIYRAVSAKPRKAALNIGRRINVKPSVVESMITAMGAERGFMFVDDMIRGGEEFIKKGVYTFVIFEVLKNDHEKNIKWWKVRLQESGFDSKMDIEKAEVAFMYLKDAGADLSTIQNFISVYNSI